MNSLDALNKDLSDKHSLDLINTLEQVTDELLGAMVMFGDTIALMQENPIMSAFMLNSEDTGTVRGIEVDTCDAETMLPAIAADVSGTLILVRALLLKALHSTQWNGLNDMMSRNMAHKLLHSIGNIDHDCESNHDANMEFVKSIGAGSWGEYRYEEAIGSVIDDNNILFGILHGAEEMMEEIEASRKDTDDESN